MSDNLPGDAEDPDALPLNKRSSAFIDSAAFLNFVRLKSRVASQEGSAKKGAVSGADVGEALKAPSADQDKALAFPAVSGAMEVEIQDEDWDSLFGAVEERLRGTVEALDLTSPQLASPDKLSRIKSVVLDCVTSLDALHKALRHDRGLHLASGQNRNIAGGMSASCPTNTDEARRKN